MVSVYDYSYYSLRKWDPIFWFGFVKILKLMFYIVDILLSLFKGTSILYGTIEERSRSHEYEYAAHVVKVLARGTIFLVENHDRSNFLYLHEAYVHPSSILKQDNIVLKGINKNFAIFCVSDKDVCTLDTTIGPFAFVNTFIAARKLIFLPMQHFHRLAQESGDPFENNLNIAIIHMTARCGSTLLGKMFENVPKTRVISEINSFLFVWNLYLRGDISLVEYEKLLDSTFRVQCKKENGIQRIIIKHSMSATSTLAYMKRAYPQIQLLFITRHPFPSLKSYDKLWTLLPVSGTIAGLANVNGIYWKHYPIPANDLIWWQRYRSVIAEGCTHDQKISMVRFFFFNYWCAVEQYTKNKGLYDMAILYEDLCERPQEIVSDLFSKLKISHINIPVALGVMATDSQKGFFGKRGSYCQTDLSLISDLLDRKFKECNIPIEMNMSLEQFRRVLK